MKKIIKNPLNVLLLFSAITIGLLVSLSYLSLDILRVQFSPSRTIAVTGVGKESQVNQNATFSASINATGNDKSVVNSELQRQADDLTQLALEFGIEKNNIKTEYFNIYQEELRDYDNPTAPVRKGPWIGNTSLSFQKVPTEKVQEFANLLASSGASNISGPNYGLEDMRAIEDELVASALVDAQEKAESYAQSQDLQLGKIVLIDTTGGSSNGIYPLMRGMGGGGGDLAFNPGDSEVTKQVLVVFELK